jgi:hypothetical protein
MPTQKTQHTPPPWRTSSGLDAVESLATGETIAVMHDWQSDAERIANCRLIASAPELLRVLTATRDHWKNRDAGAQWFAVIEAALAQATGGAK